MDISWYRFFSVQDLLVSVIGFVLLISAGSVVTRDAGALVLGDIVLPEAPMKGLGSQQIYLYGGS